MPIPSSIWFTACLLLSFLPTTSAFYPIQPKYGDSASKRSERTQNLGRLSTSILSSRRSVSLPIRRLPHRRDNKYPIVNSNDPTQANSVAIDQDGTDLSYMVAVKFGQSTEEYHLLLDSAASNTWVMSEKCTTDACSTHNSFGAGDSSTLKTEDTTFSITYGTGSVSGTLGTDDVHISSISTSLTFGLASNVSSEFSSYPMDGILGIGRGDDADGTIKAPTLMDALSTSGSIKTKLFAVHLSRASDGLNDGELNLGELNKDRYDGDINYIATVANDNGFWEIPVDDAGISGTPLGLKGRSAILDSGTSFILMPEPDAVALHKLIPDSKQSGETFTVPCTTTTPVQISFKGQAYNVSTADYIGGKMDDGSCKSNIIGRQTFGENQWLVGDVFLKNVYSVFDFDNSQVGFGVKSSGEQESVSSASPSATATPAASSGGSPTAQQTAPASGTAAASAEAQQSAAGAKASATGGAGRSTSSSSIVFGIAFGLLALFV